MPTNYIEVSFHAEVDSGEILAMLDGGEELGCWEKDGVVHIFWPENQWNSEALEDLQRVLKLSGMDPQSAGLTVQVVPDQDWNATWAASLTPINLGENFRIRQSWHPKDDSFKGIELVIDPKRAFGTGYHATTQLVVEWLEKNIRGGEKVLDVGTGSGILAMAAIRLGALSALGIDNDPVAVECAQEYARVNGFGSELELLAATFEDCAGETYDVITANIDGKTLPMLCPYLPRLLRVNGMACFSGLQQHDLEEITDALLQAGCNIRERKQREEWLSLSISLE
jgi:ribosomal protein L11 methyltransferase